MRQKNYKTNFAVLFPLNPSLSMTTLNVNRLNSPIQKAQIGQMGKKNVIQLYILFVRDAFKIDPASQKDKKSVV